MPPRIRSTHCDRWSSVIRDREHLGSQGTFSGLLKGAGVVQSCLSDNWNIPSAQEVQLQMIGGRVVPGYFFFPFQTGSVKVSYLRSLLVIFNISCWKQMKHPFLTIFFFCRLISKYLFRASIVAFLHDEKNKTGSPLVPPLVLFGTWNTIITSNLKLILYLSDRIRCPIENMNKRCSDVLW